MELKLQRIQKNSKATIGQLSIDGIFECHTLEDVDRGLKQSDILAHIKEVKVQNLTAIPTGRYEVIIDHSNHFNKDMPHIVNVPGYEGIRIHSGNTDVDTEGCILLGQWDKKSPDFISSSRYTFNTFYPKLQDALTKENVYINIL